MGRELGLHVNVRTGEAVCLSGERLGSCLSVSREAPGRVLRPVWGRETGPWQRFCGFRWVERRASSGSGSHDGGQGRLPCIDRALHFTCPWSTSRLFARVPLSRLALQFKELMEQIETGDADQKAYAAMELQTMALDSRSQAPI